MANKHVTTITRKAKTYDGSRGSRANVNGEDEGCHDGLQLVRWAGCGFAERVVRSRSCRRLRGSEEKRGPSLLKLDAEHGGPPERPGRSPQRTRPAASSRPVNAGLRVCITGGRQTTHPSRSSLVRWSLHPQRSTAIILFGPPEPPWLNLSVVCITRVRSSSSIQARRLRHFEAARQDT